jgi:hypothetical protein
MHHNLSIFSDVRGDISPDAAAAQPTNYYHGRPHPEHVNEQRCSIAQLSVL